MIHDIAIIGAGIAGAGVAAELAGTASVVLIEMESQPGYHTTGRSNAFWQATYGGPGVEPLTSASRGFLERPPPEFSETGFLSPRGAINLARTRDAHRLDDFADAFAGSGVVMEMWDHARLVQAMPGLRTEWTAALYEPECFDIDVAALHAACLRQARKMGVELRTAESLTGASYVNGAWRVETPRGEFAAHILVNAAGAWADEVATRCGVQSIGIQPYRRTIAQVEVDADVPRDLPLVIDVDGQFYFKPEGPRSLWLSPHDETATPPCDAAPEELDIALAIDRFQKVVDWPVKRVQRSWAGLRSFAPDRLPVYGFDANASGFFWCAGQGGFGIQTAPAAAQLCASLIGGSALPPALQGIDPAAYAPGRFI
jgi:D-arginine dehydrogenase